MSEEAPRRSSRVRWTLAALAFGTAAVLAALGVPGSTSFAQKVTVGPPSADPGGFLLVSQQQREKVLAAAAGIGPGSASALDVLRLERVVVSAYSAVAATPPDGPLEAQEKSEILGDLRALQAATRAKRPSGSAISEDLDQLAAVPVVP